MTTQLTPEQRLDLLNHGDKPVPVIDPETNAVYFLVSGPLFERLRSLLYIEPFDVAEAYAAKDSALAKIWNDPTLDVYNDFDKSNFLP
jgi:hypothetical protein